MYWEDTAPQKAINLGGAVGVRDAPTLFRVSILRVPEEDPLPPAFAEFWRRVLAEGPGQCSGRWDVLLFQMNLLGGGFTCVFTTRDLERDEPPVFKFSSAALEAECYALPEDDSRAEPEYRALEDRCLDLLREAVRAEPAAGQFLALRGLREFVVLACGFYRTQPWPLGL